MRKEISMELKIVSLTHSFFWPSSGSRAKPKSWRTSSTYTRCALQISVANQADGCAWTYAVRKYQDPMVLWAMDHEGKHWQAFNTHQVRVQSSSPALKLHLIKLHLRNLNCKRECWMYLWEVIVYYWNDNARIFNTSSDGHPDANNQLLPHFLTEGTAPIIALLV